MKRLSVSILVLAMLVGLPLILGAQNEAGGTGNSTAPDVNKHSSTPEIKTLIDFNVYQTRIESEKASELERNPNTNEPIFDIHTHTYKKKEGLNLYPAAPAPGDNVPTDENGIPLLKVSSDDMKLDAWKVRLNSSADKVENRVLSYARQVEAKGKNPGNVLGIRIHFPTHAYNAWARIAPAFELKVYDELGNLVNLENGVVNNTGTIKKIRVTVSGRNYKHSLALRLKDQNGNIKEFFMGNLYFKGWRTLEWSNPNYIETLNHRELFRLPLYPNEVPHLVFDSFIIYRQGDEMGGDFVTYIRKVDIEYDLAIEWPESTEELDIDDEAIWNILKVQAHKKADQERKAFAEYLELMHTERLKYGKTAAQPTTTPTTPTNP